MSVTGKRVVLRLHPGPQKKAYESRATEILYGGAAGGGKLAPVSPARYGVDDSTGVVQGVSGQWYADDMNIPESNVLTPTGWKQLGDLKVGDRVCAPDGGICKVIAVHKPGVFPIYRVTMADGSVTHAADEHLWTYSIAGKRKSRKRPPVDLSNLEQYDASAAWCAEVAMRCRTATTEDMKRDLDVALSAKGAGGRPFYPQTPVARPLNLSRTQGRWPTLTPYVIGAMIGDGCCSAASAGFTSDPADAPIVERIQRELPDGIYLAQSTTEEKSYHFQNQSALRQLLERDGLLGKRSWEKRIPERLLFAPTEQRWALAQGLFDTDGYMDDRGHIEYVTVSEGLAKDVQHLVRSLGFRATLTSKVGSYRNADGERVECRTAYRLYIQGVEKSSLFYLPRKRDRAKQFNGNDVMLSHRVESIEFVGHQTGMCITVDHPLGLYVTDDFIVTHNSHLLRVTHLAAALAMPGYQGFIYRSTSDELRMNHLVGPTSMPEMCLPWINAGFCTYHIQQMTFTFQNGAVIRFRHLGDDRKLGQAQGPDIHQLSVDELTHFDENRYRWLRGRLRCQVPIPRKFPWKLPRAISGTNPGSQGHAWVKHSFIDGCEPYETRLMPPEEGGLIRQYIPARVRDNPSIDPEQYEAALSGLGTPELVRAMRDGDWDIAVGARFAHVWSDHVMVDHFTIPRSWRLVRSFDWGSAKPFSYGLWAISNGDQPYDENLPFFPPGTMVRIAEWYGWTGRPDEGIRMQAKEVGRRIRRLEEKLGYYGRIQPGGADSACFTRERDQKSVHDDLASAGVRFRPVPKGSGSRVAGWRVLDDMLAATRDGNVERPRIYAFKSCHQFRRLIPIVASDPHDPEDVDTKAEDHLPDEVRYAVSMRVGGTRIVRPGGV